MVVFWYFLLVCIRYVELISLLIILRMWNQWLTISCMHKEGALSCQNKSKIIPACEAKFFITTRKCIQTTFILVNFLTQSFVLCITVIREIFISTKSGFHFRYRCYVSKEKNYELKIEEILRFLDLRLARYT